MIQKIERGLFFYKYKHILKNPFLRVLFIILVILYVLMPFDLVPDFLFPIGYIDDILIVLALIAAVLTEYKSSRNS